MSAPPPATALRNLRRLQVAAAILCAIALAASLAGSPRVAVAAFVVVLFLNIFAIDAIRFVVANLRGRS